MNIGFVFPGQGSQSVGMLADLASAYPVVRETFEEGGDVLGLDLWALVQNGPEETLGQTEHTQPALLAAGLAVARVWESAGGPHPILMAGHSLGEYTALVCAGAIGYTDAIELVRARGQLMQSAVPEGRGAMAAILGLDDQAVATLCADAAEDQVVSPANFNSPGQVVIAGHREAVERAMTRAQDAGARRVVALSVSVPSHCALMEPAVAGLSDRLAGTAVQGPGLPVIHNADARSHTDPETIREVLALQLHSPVRWVDCVRVMAAEGVETILEMGPGRILTGLNKRIDKSLNGLSVYDPRTIEKAMSACEGF